MRESSFTYPPHNRAVVSITHMLYDRRALDVNSPMALLQNLTSLTYLTSTSPRIREILTIDGGLERLLDILRDSCHPRDPPPGADIWGLFSPPTARIINSDRQTSLRHALAFQSVVNIGVRGSEQIRTRVVQAGALDLVAQILENYLRIHGIGIFAAPTGSQASIDAHLAAMAAGYLPSNATARDSIPPDPLTMLASAATGGHAPRGIGSRLLRAWDREDLIQSTSRGTSVGTDASGERDLPPPRADPMEADVDADIEMGETADDEANDEASAAGDASMEIDMPEIIPDVVEAPQPIPSQELNVVPQSHPATTPRASSSALPLPMPLQIPQRHASARPDDRDPNSAANLLVSQSLTDDDMDTIQRAASDNDLAVVGRQPSRPVQLDMSNPRSQQVPQEIVSNQSSPTGGGPRHELGEGTRRTGRRGTIVARQHDPNLAPPEGNAQTGSGPEDGPSDTGEQTAYTEQILRHRWNRTAALATAAMGTGGAPGNGERTPENETREVEVRDPDNLIGPDAIDPAIIEAEQARQDLEAGAPPGQPGAIPTPQIHPTVIETPPRQIQAPGIMPPGAFVLDDPARDAPTAQIIVANGAPRGFQDLGSYVGISTLLNPGGDKFSEDSVLLSLQLLAYLSKYPHVRSIFHHPRVPTHMTFDLKAEKGREPLPQRPAVSETPDIFSLVERFTFRPTAADPMMFSIPKDVHYWAGVIMRNACRKDDTNGGVRQCANMTCGKWEQYPREFAKCRRCRKAKYCSKECQSRAWSEGHRFWCNARPDGEGLPGHPGTENPFDGVFDQDLIEDDELARVFPQADLPRDVRNRAITAARNLLHGIRPGAADAQPAPAADPVQGPGPGGPEQARMTARAPVQQHRQHRVTNPLPPGYVRDPARPAGQGRAPPLPPLFHEMSRYLGWLVPLWERSNAVGYHVLGEFLRSDILRVFLRERAQLRPEGPGPEDFAALQELLVGYLNHLQIPFDELSGPIHERYLRRLAPAGPAQRAAMHAAPVRRPGVMPPMHAGAARPAPDNYTRGRQFGVPHGQGGPNVIMHADPLATARPQHVATLGADDAGAIRPASRGSPSAGRFNLPGIFRGLRPEARDPTHPTGP